MNKTYDLHTGCMFVFSTLIWGGRWMDKSWLCVGFWSNGNQNLRGNMAESCPSFITGLDFWAQSRCSFSSCCLNVPVATSIQTLWFKLPNTVLILHSHDERLLNGSHLTSPHLTLSQSNDDYLLPANKQSSTMVGWHSSGNSRQITRAVASLHTSVGPLFAWCTKQCIMSVVEHIFV